MVAQQPRHRSAVILFAALALLASACSSTTARGRDEASPVVPVDESDVASSGDPSRGVDAASTEGSDGGRSAALSQDGSTTAAAPNIGQGVTANTITIGIQHYDKGDVVATVAAMGFAGTETGDTRAYAEAIVKYINASGGIAGRRLLPVYVSQPAITSAETQQEACTAFSEDNQVFAVTKGTGGAIDVLGPCLGKRSTSLVVANIAPMMQST